MNKLKKNRNSIYGYTILELLGVIAILGILTAIGLPFYNGYSLKAKINAATANHQNYFKALNVRIISCQSNRDINIPIKNYPGFVDCRAGRGYIGDSIAFKTLKEVEEKAKNPYNGQPASSTSHWGNGSEPSSPALGYTAFGYKYSYYCRPGGIRGQIVVIITNIGNLSGSSEFLRNEVCTAQI